MKPIETRLIQVTFLAGAVALAMTAATPTQGGTAGAPAIRSVAFQGNQLAIVVVNPAGIAQSGTAAVRVMTARGEATVLAPFTVGAAQTAVVRVEIAEPVIGALPCGVVVDDGVPM